MSRGTYDRDMSGDETSSDAVPTGTSGELGWAGRSRDDPDVVALREHLEANNGLAGLEMVEAGDVDRAVRLFRRDGFVVVADALTDAQTSTLRAGCDSIGLARG